MGKIIVADSLLPEKKLIIELLRSAGHQVVAETGDVGNTLRRARSLYCDLIIVDNGLEGGTGLKTATIIDEDQLAAVLLLVESVNFLQPMRIPYLVKPISVFNLVPAVEAALFYWRKQSDLREELRNMKDKLDTQKSLNKAKGVLIDKLGMNESDAHRFIQKEAMNHGLTIREVAAAIIKKYL